MTILAESTVPSNSNESISYRLCVTAIVETRQELALFAARVPEYRVEINATPKDQNGYKTGDDIKVVVYDIAGLAEMLILVLANLPQNDPPIRVYGPIAVPSGYDHALALIVARVEAMRERLETHLHNTDESEFDTTGERLGANPAAAWLRMAEWAAWEAMDGTEGSVKYGYKAIAESLLADAMTAEATAEDAADWDEAASSAVTAEA